MNRLALTLTLGLAVVMGACQRETDEATAMGMTPEEHARMMAGVPPAAAAPGDTSPGLPIQLTQAEERALGVQYAVVRRETLTRTVRTVAQIVAPEPGVVEVTPRVEGFVERLHVATTGEPVRSGQPLLDLYSPMLVAAQEELLTARRLVEAVDPAAGDARRSAEAMLAAARRRLAYWDISEEQIQRLERTGEVQRALTLVAPAAGVVLDKDVVEGQRVMPGMRLYRLADLSTVWAEGEVFERDLRLVRLGTPVHVEVDAHPGEHLMARVTFVSPVVDPRTRTTRVRLEIPNPGGRLKPGMFATVFVDVVVGRDVLTVPADAVLATGERNLVFVREADGMLAPRLVVVGDGAGGRVTILSGLAEGERVVAAATFLVDAESRLRVAGDVMPGHQHGAPVPPAPPPTEPHHD
jgi:Cu(I)/Ag(I) efflux system membrane fusion protein